MKYYFIKVKKKINNNNLKIDLFKIMSELVNKLILIEQTANSKWSNMTPMTPHIRSSMITSNLMPLAKKYKRAHYFKPQVSARLFEILKN